MLLDYYVGKAKDFPRNGSFDGADVIHHYTRQASIEERKSIVAEGRYDEAELGRRVWRMVYNDLLREGVI